jgi:16S rRNA (cytosine1402-N4)-methyltransferase
VTHTSVLLEEVLEALQPWPSVGYRALDATLGAGGHAAGLLERSSPDGFLIGLDADPTALEAARTHLSKFAGRFELRHANFRDLKELDIAPVNGIVLDLGLSSTQLEASGRGFSFRSDEPLDMRFDPQADTPTAANLLNELPEAELERIIKSFGEEPRARRLAKVIVQRRPLRTTTDLVAAVTQALGPARGRIHPATRTFQALRIAVNDELEALEAGLAAAIELLKPRGRLAVISFHSLEDRIVKWRLRGWADQGRVQILTKKPIVPSHEEARANPRARSGKLRVAQRMGE